MSKPVKNINQTPTEGVLKKSLLALLYKKPIEKITVKELCELSDIYRSTFYAHYKSPEALLQKIQEEEIEKFLSFTQITSSYSMENIRENAIAFLTYIKEHDYTLRALLFHESDKKIYHTFASTIARQFRMITKDYNLLHSEEYTPIFMSHGLLICIMHWMQTDYAAPVEELADLLFQTLHSVNEVRK